MCSWQVKRLMLDAFNLPDVGGPESAVSETTSMIMISHDLRPLYIAPPSSNGEAVEGARWRAGAPLLAEKSWRRRQGECPRQ